MLEIGKATSIQFPSSVRDPCVLTLAASWGVGAMVHPEQPSIRAGEKYQTPQIVYAQERS
jgi:hypothetical protein